MNGWTIQFLHGTVVPCSCTPRQIRENTDTITTIKLSELLAYENGICRPSVQFDNEVKDAA